MNLSIPTARISPLRQRLIDDMIERRNSRSVTIGDWRKLAEAGDFDSTYLHLRENEPALD